MFFQNFYFTAPLTKGALRRRISFLAFRGYFTTVRYFKLKECDLPFDFPYNINARKKSSRPIVCSVCTSLLALLSIILVFAFFCMFYQTIRRPYVCVHCGSFSLLSG